MSLLLTFLWTLAKVCDWHSIRKIPSAHVDECRFSPQYFSLRVPPAKSWIGWRGWKKKRSKSQRNTLPSGNDSTPFHCKILSFFLVYKKMGQKCGWNTNGTQLFSSVDWKLKSRWNRTYEKVVSVVLGLNQNNRFFAFQMKHVFPWKNDSQFLKTLTLLIWARYDGRETGQTLF